MLHNKLKDVDVATLQKTIAEAVGKLIGTELQCRISKVDYSRKPFSQASADLEISLSEPLKSSSHGTENPG